MLEVLNFLADQQPLLMALSVLLSVGVLGLIVRMTITMRDALSEQRNALLEQKRVVEERLQATNEDLTRTEKWNSREQGELRARLSDAQAALKAALDSEGLSVENLVEHLRGVDLRAEVRQALGEAVGGLLEMRAQLGPAEDIEPRSYLEAARALTASNDWAAAAEQYDRYVATNPEDWRVQFLRAVAYANSRGGEVSNRQALRAYNEVLAFFPEEGDPNLRARAHGYRGAMLKRMWRLAEAEGDLLIARSLATARYEVEDTKYNLACVFTMQGRKAEAMTLIAELTENTQWRGVIATKHEYFEALWHDQEFQELIRYSP